MKNVIAALALLLSTLSANADQLLGGLRIDNSNSVIIPGGPTLGKFSAGQYEAQPDSLTIKSLNGFNVPYSRSITGAVTRTLLDKLGDLPFTPQDFGAATNGTTAVDAAFAKLIAAPGDVIIPPGNWRLSTSATWPRGKNYTFITGAQIRPDANAVITIRGKVIANNSTQIFGGAGRVEGLRYNRPEWFGGIPTYNSGVDSAAAINAAIKSAEAAYSPSDPTNPSDGDRPTVDLGGGTFWNVCSPVYLTPQPHIQFTLKGSGQINGGSQIIACPTFTGGQIVQIHGISPNVSFGSWDAVLENFSIYDPNRRSTACVRTVPEGAGYVLNPGNQRPSRIDNVTAQGCPIGFDIVNTLQMTMRAPSYLGIGTSNNTGIRFATAGTGATANTGEITVYDSNLDPCPPHNAGSCTNTTNVKFESSGGSGSPAGPAIAAIKFSGNNIMWGANVGWDISATAGGFIADLWNNGSQYDGTGCFYFRATSDGANSTIVNIHNDHLYHTTVASAACVPHIYNAVNGGKISHVWETNGEFIIGGSAQSTFFINGVTNYTVSGNLITGSGTANAAIANYNTSKGTIFGNVVDVISGGTAWTNGVLLSGSTKMAVTGNVCSGTSGACVTGVDSSNSVSSGNTP